MTAHSPPARAPGVQRGRCHVLYAFDIGLGIDLDHANRVIASATQRESIKDKRRAPETVISQPAPLRMTRPADPIQLGAFTTDPNVDVVLYDFGAVAVRYAMPLAGSLADLERLSGDLYDNEPLARSARQIVDAVARSVAPAVRRPGIANLVEDYAIFHIEAFDQPCDLNTLIARHGDQVARILRASQSPVSDQEVADALACRISYAADDAALIDWAATLLVGPDADDVRTVLEFANVELLELRFLDSQLDAALEQSYRVLSRRRGPGWGLFGSLAAEVRRIGRLQVDNAVLFEGVNNALKLLGDQYLARVYRLASQRFHLAEWDAAILRKIETIDSIYSKESDRQINVRMEILEWIIIILIAAELVLPFLRPR